MSSPIAYLHHASAPRLAAALPGIGDSLSAQLVNLYRDPTPWGCEVMAANLDAARASVLRLHEALRREQSPTPDDAA